MDNMKRNSDLQSTWSSCVIQMLKRQTRVKGGVRCNDKYINLPSAAALDKNVIGKGDTKKPDTDFYKHDEAKSYQHTDVG